MMSISTMRQMKQRALYENSGYAPKIFLKILHNERSQGSLLIVLAYTKKIFVHREWIILGLKT